MISLTKLIKSLTHAWHGLAEVWQHEHSFRIHIAAFIVLLVAIIGLGIKGTEAAVLILVAASVIVLELANSVVERVLDIVAPRVGEQVHDAKDIMAAAVLVASLFAVAIGAIIIIPHLKF